MQCDVVVFRNELPWSELSTFIGVGIKKQLGLILGSVSLVAMWGELLVGLGYERIIWIVSEIITHLYYTLELYGMKNSIPLVRSSFE